MVLLTCLGLFGVSYELGQLNSLRAAFPSNRIFGIPLHGSWIPRDQIHKLLSSGTHTKSVLPSSVWRSTSEGQLHRSRGVRNTPCLAGSSRSIVLKGMGLRRHVSMEIIAIKVYHSPGAEEFDYRACICSPLVDTGKQFY